MKTGASAKEALIVTGLLIALMGLAISLRDASLLVTRPLWLDEQYTWLIANAGFSTGFQALADGTDLNPPLLYILLWSLRATGELSAADLRLFSLAAVTLGLLFAYLTLRRWTPRVAAFAAIVAVWAHPLLLFHSFEARFYGPFFLCAALLAFSVGVDRDAAFSSKRDWAIGVSSAALCTIHYFGVLAWGLIAVVTALSWAFSDRFSWRRVLPLLAGPLALLACLPLYLGQRGAVGDVTWIAEFSFRMARSFIGAFYFWLPAIGMLLLWFILTTSRFWRTTFSEGLSEDVYAMLSLLLLPFAVILLSITLQPAMIPRYAIASLVGFVPIFAMVITRLPSGVRVGILLVLFGWFLNKVGDTAEVRRRFVAQVRADSTQVALAGDKDVVVFRNMGPLAPLIDKLPERRLVFPILPPQEVRAVFPADPGKKRATIAEAILMEQASGTAMARWFGRPLLMERSEIGEEKAFWLFNSIDDPTEVARYAGAFFPAHEVRRVTPHMYRLTLSSEGSSGD